MLAKCRELAGPDGVVIVALDSDENVRRLKGNGRPVNTFAARREVLRSIKYVDHVLGFENELGLLELIAAIKPNYLVKGPPLKPPNAEKEGLLSLWGGSVFRFAAMADTSTTDIIRHL